MGRKQGVGKEYEVSMSQALEKSRLKDEIDFSSTSLHHTVYLLNFVTEILLL
jgi:hypothetical protein